MKLFPAALSPDSLLAKPSSLPRRFGCTVLFAGIFSAVSAYAIPQVATPTFSPAAGSYSNTQSVTISSATSGASIAYTTDGSVPTESGGTLTHGSLFSGPISIGTTTSLSAIAFETGFADSTLAIGGYTFPWVSFSGGVTVTNMGFSIGGGSAPASQITPNLNPQAAAPTFSPAAGTFESTPQTVTISSATSGASIRYTLDGSTPTETIGTLYSSPVSIYSTTILKAIAYGTGLTDSTITNGVYTITNAPAFSLNVLFNFSPANNGGIFPTAPMVLGTDGNFYGTTFNGGSTYSSSSFPGYGTVFKMTPAGVLTTLASFIGTNGANPDSALIEGTDGNFYGTTMTGGSTFVSASNPGDGTVFKITPTGTFTTLVSFTGANGFNPDAKLVQGTDGNFYGTTNAGGSTFFSASAPGDGTVFKITPTGTLTTLVSFTGLNGFNPDVALVQGTDGNFYSTTSAGGSTFVSASNAGDGTVFKMTPAGVLTTLVSFTGLNGFNPDAALIQGTDGNFYGTTENGGSTFSSASSPGDGTVFKITTANSTFTSLASFTGVNGFDPNPGLIQGTDGNFYGTTSAGGSTFSSASSPGDGTVFKITPTGSTFTTLVSFTGTNGINPNPGMVQGTDGNFYGTTENGGSSSDGTAFQITPAGVLTNMIPFTGFNGDTPNPGLIQGTDGNFYGTTTVGGLSGDGVGFQLIPPPIQVLAPYYDPIGGNYPYARYVTITSPTSGATIRFTTDGSTPTETNGTVYSSQILISVTTKLQSIAYKSGMADSPVTDYIYTIGSSPASAGGGGGGGAPSYWFLGFLAFAGILRWKFRKTQAHLS